MIQEYDIVPALLHTLYGLCPGGCLVGDYAVALHELPGHLAVHVIIIHHEYPGVMGVEILLLLTPVGALLKPLREVAYGLGIYDSLLEIEGELRALSVLTLDLERAAHEVQEPCDDGHAQSRALYIPVPGLIQSGEGLEELVPVLVPDADACVLDGYMHEEPRVISLFPGKGERDTPLLRVFDRVGQQVHDHLADADIVTE